MSSNEAKPKNQKISSKNSVSDISISELNSEKEKSISVSEKVYLNTKINIENVIALSNGLKNKEGFNKFIDENQKINKIYENEENITTELKNNCAWKLNNDLFEERAIKILSDFYELTEYNMYPYFDVGYSKTKKSNVVKLYFNQVNLSFKEKDSDKEEKNIFSLLFLADRDTYMFKYETIPIIIQKYKDEFYSVTVSTDDFKNSIDFEFKRGDKISTASFLLYQINPDLMEAKNDIKKLKNEKDSIDNKEKKEEFKRKLKSYETILLSMEKKYSKENLEFELNSKKNELTILQEKVNLNKIKNEEAQKNINELKVEIDNINKLLKRIIIKIEKKDREFDGLFFASKKIVLKNSIGDSLEIPEKSPIIVEVKNIIKYKTIIENIISKKKLMTSLGFNTEKFYFIGILRGIDVDKDKKDKINKTLYKDLNRNNMIILYADKLDFLGQPLMVSSTGINEEEKSNKLKDNNIYELLKQFKEEVKNEISGVKNELAIVKKELKNEINEIRTEINDIKKDISELKSKVNNKNN